MTDPTPEESGEPFYQDWRHCLEHPAVLIQGEQTCFICDAINVAVAAETERAWEAVLTLSTKDMNEYETETASADDYVRSVTRHVAFMEAIAAIRAEVKDG